MDRKEEEVEKPVFFFFWGGGVMFGHFWYLFKGFS